MYRIFSVGSRTIFNQDAYWIRSILDVVPKDSTAPHIVEFRKNPTRDNLKTLMKKEGIRHMEPGEERKVRAEPDMNRLADRMLREKMKRERIEI